MMTVGRATTSASYTRKYLSDNNNSTIVSKELTILPFAQSSRALSAEGDSGFVVIDGGGGGTDSTDVTYGTPISFVMEIIRRYKPLANAYLKSVLPA